MRAMLAVGNNGAVKAQTWVRSLMGLWLAARACTCTAAEPAAAPERSSYWREKVSFFQTFAAPAEVAMVGDSLTDGAEWHELFPAQDIVNRGIDGDTTEGVLARLDSVLAVRPQRVFLMIGINDFAEAGRPVPAVFGSYQKIVARLLQSGARVFIQSTLPCNEVKAAWKSCAQLNGQIRRLNAQLATLASGRVSFIDLWPLLAAPGGLRSEFTEDGVHLNGPGYRLWKDALVRFMPLLPASQRNTAPPARP